MQMMVQKKPGALLGSTSTNIFSVFKVPEAMRVQEIETKKLKEISK